MRPSSLRAGFDAVIAAVFAEAELELPTGARLHRVGRRAARQPLRAPRASLLAEMQVLARQHPGATW